MTSLVLCVQTDPFIIKRGVNDYTGFSYDLLVALAKKLKFQFTLRDVTETQRTGDYDPLVQELIKGVSDLRNALLDLLPNSKYNTPYA